MTSATTALNELTGTWTIDPAHSRVGFAVRHAMVATVRGSFSGFEGTLNLNGADPQSSSATLTISTASIDTANADRDGHLRSPDFLDVEAHPSISFVGTGVKAGDDENSYVLSGDITIHGTTKPIDVEVSFEGIAKDPFGNTRAGFEGTATISRKEFGISFNAPLDSGGVLVGDKIKIQLDISAIKSA
ncbi:YceI family protein [Frankia sp. Cppng1_Ct_nod]|uniref:YceI family protein n=1 Tax=Frankia sp. Cppng1_Ct_nod TaxID=2897162 RepID=UPI002024BB30|nr:YceI family protein [Frankia sp. Cppng1_Ct_nod]